LLSWIGSRANKTQSEPEKCRSAILVLEKQELVKAASELMTETFNITELKKVNTESAGFRRRFILAEMFAFKLGLQCRRWDIKRVALDEDIKNPRPKKEHVRGAGKRGEGRMGPKLGKYDVLPGGKKGKGVKKDRFGRVEGGRVAKKGKKEGKPRREREPKRNPHGPSGAGDPMEY